MIQQIIDLIQSLVITFLVIRNIRYYRIIKQNADLILKQSQIGLAQGKLLNRITDILKDTSKQQKKNELHKNQ